MGEDETSTLARLKELRATVLDPTVRAHKGRVVKVMGDGVLIEFGSAVNAVQCAIDLQQGMAAANKDQSEDRQIVWRIGVNLGDVIVESSDLYGDGVNIASRLEAVAEPGGILISGTTYDQVRGKIKVAIDDLGAQSLKNIAEPVRTYRLHLDGVTQTAPLARPAPSLPDKPSIAILPFQNMSGESEQEYFADGMVEEIITALSRFGGLFVIARNSSFTYKGRNVDVKQVGREMGVRYVLEGSVRKAGSRVRITGQLIDTATGAHLWADRFDGGIEDVFDLQDQVTASVVGAIAPKVEQAEIERSHRKPTGSLDAYDYYLRGLASAHQWTKEANFEALIYFSGAIERDPDFAAAYGWAARCYSQRKSGGWSTDSANEISKTKRLARRAAELGRNDAVALCTAGIALAYVVGDLDDAEALTDRALVLNPNLALAWLFGGWVKLWVGEAEVAIERFAHGMRLSPNDPQNFALYDAMAAAHFTLGRYAEGLSWSKSALREQPDFVLAVCVAAANASQAGRLEDAQRFGLHLRRIAPDLRIANIATLFMPEFRRPEDIARLTEALRKAGLPE